MQEVKYFRETAVLALWFNIAWLQAQLPEIHTTITRTDGMSNKKLNNCKCQGRSIKYLVSSEHIVDRNLQNLMNRKTKIPCNINKNNFK